VTSSVRGDGKSTTAVNLAYVLAADKKRVLLIDGDLRLPSLTKKMDIHSTPGLTNLLVSYDVSDLEQFRSKVLENWYIIPSGALPPNPSELLGSQKMQKLLKLLSEQFDYIVLDLPPVSVVADALAVSKLVTGMILVVRQDYTDKKDLEVCVRHLELSGVKVMGCVLNDNKDRSIGKYHRYSGSYRYSYSEEKKPIKRPPVI
jgi:capsular exopolysaccharide synthesis family protein